MKLETQYAFDWRDKSGRRRQVTRWLGSAAAAGKFAKALSKKHRTTIGREAIDARPVGEAAFMKLVGKAVTAERRTKQESTRRRA